jgi:hypothetical protein
MRVPDFELERWKFTRQYFCKYDLTETGVDPLAIRDPVTFRSIGSLLFLTRN